MLLVIKTATIKFEPIFFLRPKKRKRYSWNPSMFRGLEHPSGFPSMLRGSTPEPRPLVRKDSYGSTNQLRRTDSNGISVPSALSRKDSSGSSVGNRRDSFGTNYSPRKDSNGSVLSRKDSNGSVSLRKDSNGSVLSRKDSNGSVLSRKDSNGSVLMRRDSPDYKPNKRDSLNDDFRRLSFGSSIHLRPDSSIYLRPDSTGATNLIRRDSFGRRDSTKSARNPRDYVSKIFEYKTNNGNGTTINGNGTTSPETPETNSILRKPDNDGQTNKENVNSDLTTSNIAKHVTIWEKDGDEQTAQVEKIVAGRRDSSGSLGNYLASRRISVDSLDVRRNSRRGSTASGDINLSTINDESQEVNTFTYTQYRLTQNRLTMF